MEDGTVGFFLTFDDFLSLSGFFLNWFEVANLKSFFQIQN